VPRAAGFAFRAGVFVFAAVFAVRFTVVRVVAGFARFTGPFVVFDLEAFALFAPTFVRAAVFARRATGLARVVFALRAGAFFARALRVVVVGSSLPSVVAPVLVSSISPPARVRALASAATRAG
jgi:hypothetical protein